MGVRGVVSTEYVGHTQGTAINLDLHSRMGLLLLLLDSTVLEELWLLHIIDIRLCEVS
jgi:hypothetical protein